MINLPTIEDAGELRGKRVLLHIDANVIENDQILDDFRLKKVSKTINYLRDQGAIVIMIGHAEDGDLLPTLAPVAKYFDAKLLPLSFDKKNIDILSTLKSGDLVLLENLRMNKGEKSNSTIFAKKLASLADIHINDAFSVSHRNHASVVSLPKFLPTYFGFVFEEEVKNLSQALNPAHPFVFILGGAKFKTKMSLVEKFLNKADKIFIGGALANTLLKARGHEVGVSIVDEGVDLKQILESRKIILPEDLVVLTGDNLKILKESKDVLPDDNILDNGPRFVELIKDQLIGAKFVLWNGPLGSFEKGFKEQTEELAKVIAQSKAKSIVGGGDTLAAISSLGLLNNFSFVSTGGGAMLDFLANETLPGIDAVMFPQKN